MATQKRLATLLRYNLNQEYSLMCGSFKGRMSLAIVRSNSLILQSPRDKAACILQSPKLLDGAVMALLAPWRG